MLNGSDLYEAMNGIDPDLIEEAEKAPPAPRRSVLRWALPAAAAFVLAAGIFFVGYRAGETRAETVGTPEFSHTVNLDADPIPHEKIRGEIRDLSPVISNSFNNYVPTSSLMPGSFSRHFDTAAEARDFVGLEGLLAPYFPYETGETTLYGSGDAEGRILTANIETSDFSHPVHVQVITQIVTDLSSSSSNSAQTVCSLEDLTYTDRIASNSAGLSYQTVASSAMQSGYEGLTGYVVIDDVVYSIHLAFLEADRSEAERILAAWADSFEVKK